MKTTTPTPKTKIDVTALCARAIDLHRRKTALEDELKPIKDQLIAIAAKDKKSQIETDSGGRSWIHGDDQGHSVRVSFPVESYPAVSSENKELFAAVREIAGDELKNLFDKATVLTPVKKFPLRVHEQLGGVDAATLLDLVRKENSPKISFVLKEAQ